MSIISNDIRMTEEGDLFFKNGDFSIWNSNQEHAVAISVSNLNDWKEEPEVGLGIQNYQNAPLSSNLILKQQATEQFKNDGFNIQDLKIESDIRNNKLILKTNAKRDR